MELKAFRLLLAHLLLGGLLTACVTTPTATPTPANLPVGVTPSATVIAAVTATQLVAAPSATVEPRVTPVPPTLTPTANLQTHTVVVGDTLFRIALNAGVSVEALQAANGLTGDTIFVGQVLVIPIGTQVSTATPAVGVTLTSISTLAATATPFAPPASTAGSLAWDTSPQALIIRTYSDCCEMAYDSTGYIPEAQVWGDGRIVWASATGAGGRTVLTGQLSPQQLTELLQSFVDEGFFSWQDNYQTYLGGTLRATHITVNISGASKTVTELQGAPAAYYDLLNALRVGAGALPNPYTPTRGYLTAKLFGGDPGALPQWPATAAGFTLDQVGSGRYIEGEPLAFAWALVNKGPNAPVYAQSNGQLYVIMVQIPGLSLNPLPS